MAMGCLSADPNYSNNSGNRRRSADTINQLKENHGSAPGEDTSLGRAAGRHIGGIGSKLTSRRIPRFSTILNLHHRGVFNRGTRTDDWAFYSQVDLGLGLFNLASLIH